MTTWTHQFTEQGNGFPDVGDDVLLEGDCGWHTLLRVLEIDSISTAQTGSGMGNSVLLRCERSPNDYDDMNDDAADAAWESLHHVAEIAKEPTR